MDPPKTQILTVPMMEWESGRNGCRHLESNPFARGRESFQCRGPARGGSGMHSSNVMNMTGEKKR
ncbi:MAG: hypothetical protein ACYC9S_04660 [Leptospirales bacterium]